MLLRDDQTRQILAFVAAAHLQVAHLEEELTDHLCCEIEARMDAGSSFEDAFAEVTGAVKGDALSQIEEDTLLLTDNHYALMRTTLKISGTASLVLLAVGTLMRLLHLSGANVLLTSGFIALCLVFFPASAFLDYARSAQKKTGTRILLLLGCNALAAGVLFKVMHWNGANILLLSGWVLMLGLFLPLVLLGRIRKLTTPDERNVHYIGVLALFVFELGTLMKFLHLPGTAVMMVTGSVLLAAVFLPWYALRILKKQEASLPVFIFLVILCIYSMTMTMLISIRPVENPVPVTQTTTLQSSRI